MMGVDPAKLTFRSYQALLGEWADRHSKDGAGAREPVTGEALDPLKRFLAAHTRH